MSYYECICLLSCCILLCVFLLVFASIEVLSASFCCLLYCLPLAPPVWLIVCFYVCTSLIWFSPPWTWSATVVLDCVSLRFFFYAPLPPSVPSLPPLSLSWFGNALGFSEWWWILVKPWRPFGPITGPFFFKYPYKQPNNSVVNSVQRALDYTSNYMWLFSLWWMIWIMNHSCAISVVFCACWWEWITSNATVWLGGY